MTKTFKRLVLAGHSSYPSFPEIILLSYSWLGEQTCAPYCALIPAEPSGPSTFAPSGPNPTPTSVCTSEHQSAFILAMLGPDQHVCRGKLLLFVKERLLLLSFCGWSPKGKKKTPFWMCMIVMSWRFMTYHQHSIQNHWLDKANQWSRCCKRNSLSNEGIFIGESRVQIDQYTT